MPQHVITSPSTSVHTMHSYDVNWMHVTYTCGRQQVRDTTASPMKSREKREKGEECFQEALQQTMGTWSTTPLLMCAIGCNWYSCLIRYLLIGYSLHVCFERVQLSFNRLEWFIFSCQRWTLNIQCIFRTSNIWYS